ncbi:MAG: glycoside hydrolase family 172 protein [Verrucomicrobiota bacterium]
MKKHILALLSMSVLLAGCKKEEEKFSGLNMNMGNLYRMSDAKTRSISGENPTGEKGKGGMATLKDGTARVAAREYGQGWKVNPCAYLEPGEKITAADIQGEGAIQHIWITVDNVDPRLCILRIYWDDETEPSVEVPVGDFFAAGWGKGADCWPSIQSLAVCTNPKNGFNCYWQMPFRKRCRITMENMNDTTMVFFYQVDYALTDVPDDAAYFHAQFNRVHPLPHMENYTIVDNIKGKGQYVGTYLARGTYDYGWWGEGEIKFFMDGDTKFPTICGTGEEDYFCGSYAYTFNWQRQDNGGVPAYDIFDSPYSGFHYFLDDAAKSYVIKIGQYRWHIVDPIRFESDLKVTIQSLGWQYPEGEDQKYKHLPDDLASVAFWYQQEPHNPFSKLPSKEELVVKKEKTSRL